jgi:hypothetical protein
VFARPRGRYAGWPLHSRPVHLWARLPIARGAAPHGQRDTCLTKCFWKSRLRPVRPSSLGYSRPPRDIVGAGRRLFRPYGDGVHRPEWTGKNLNPSRERAFTSLLHPLFEILVGRAAGVGHHNHQIERFGSSVVENGAPAAFRCQHRDLLAAATYTEFRVKPADFKRENM